MAEPITQISKAQSYSQIGEFWDTHDSADFWEQTEEVDFEVDIQSHRYYFALDGLMVSEAGQIAAKRGISTETLLNLWIQEKLRQEIEPAGIAG
jgi:hypothetical protein